MKETTHATSVHTDAIHVRCIPQKLHRVLFCYKLLWLYFALLVDIHPYSPAWWRHQMETFSALLALCAGNSPVPVNSPHKGQWRGALMFSLIYAWINDWANNREAGDLRRHRGHYDVIVMGYSDTGTLVPVKYLGGISVKFTYQNHRKSTTTRKQTFWKVNMAALTCNVSILDIIILSTVYFM